MNQLNSTVYIKNIKTLKDPLFNKSLLKDIPKWRQEHILKFRFPEDRIRSYGVWDLLIKKLKALGINPNQISLGSFGKPEHPNINFSLSHSGNFILITINKRLTGCDIEKIEDFPVNIKSRIFSEFEKQRYHCCSDELKNEYLYRVWTAKESYLKLSGRGLINNLDSITIDLSKNNIYENTILQNIQLKSVKINNYIYSTCEEE